MYSADKQLLGSTNEVTAVNSGDSVLAGVLAAPVLLQHNSTYYLAVWMDVGVYMPWTTVYQAECIAMPYTSSAAFPSNFTTASYLCGELPLAGLGCSGAVVVAPSSTGTVAPGPVASSSAPITPGPATSSSGPVSPAPATSSTGSSSVIGGNPTTTTSSNSGGSSDVSLSKGAVAGIVIGCVVGTNLLLLICLFLACGLGRKGSSSPTHKSTRSTSEVEPAQPRGAGQHGAFQSRPAVRRQQGARAIRTRRWCECDTQLAAQSPCGREEGA